MRRIVVTVFIMCFWVAPGRAQLGSIGLYMDTNGLDCGFTDQSPVLQQVYVIQKNNPGTTGVEFMVQPSAGFTCSYLSDVVQFPTTIGNSQTGVSIGYGTCISSDVLVLAINYFCNGTSSPCSFIQVVPHPNPSIPGQIAGVDCAAQLRTLTGLKLTANPDVSCPACPKYTIFTNMPMPSADLVVDGTVYQIPVAFHWTPGDPHVVAPGSPVSQGDTTWVFSSWSDGGADTHTIIAPAVSDTLRENFTKLFNYAAIGSIVDVPGDQGGWVRMSFKRSAFDDSARAGTSVTDYGIWQRIDNTATIQAILDRGVREDTPGDLRTAASASSEPAGPRALRGLPALRWNDRYFVSGDAELQAAGFPAGMWELVQSVPAISRAEYIVRIPTVVDSSPAGIPYSVYVTTAVDRGGVFGALKVWTSPPDSGYSVDNIPPGVPGGFVAAYNTGAGNQLSWDASTDTDFQYFNIYRGNDPAFVPSPANRVQSTAGTAWTDPSFDGWNVYYKITALDHAGNESGPASPVVTSGVGGDQVPGRYALYQNTPNPFNPATVIRYDVPRGGGRVTLRIFDVAGRLVRTLVDAEQIAGVRRVTWDGRDNQGNHVSSGLFFYRLTAPGFQRTRKMVLLQ